MKYVVYRYAISIGFLSFYRTSRPYRVSNQIEAILKGLPYSLLSLILGWWGLPWGPIWTIQSISINLSGGSSVNDQNQSSSNVKTGDSLVYPNMRRIKESIKALYKHLSSEGIQSFSRSISPQQILINPKEDSVIATHQLASLIVNHLMLPDGSILVNYRKSLEHAGQVELTPENEYLVEINARYKDSYRDVIAILSHEITHVFLYRAKLFFPDQYDNEILTDTTSVYLGVGWLSLNAFRLTETRESNSYGQSYVRYQEQRLGYLTPEEFGYVLGKRSIVFKEKVNNYIKSSAAKDAFRRGLQRARIESKQAPLKNCGLFKRILYQWHQKRIIDLSHAGNLKGSTRSFDGYQFDISDEIKVVFECPVCSQKLRLPIKKNIVAHCNICQANLNCKT